MNLQGGKGISLAVVISALIGLIVLMPVNGVTLAYSGEAVVLRTNICRKGTLIMKTTESEYVAAVQEAIGSRYDGPWADTRRPKCSFFPGEKIYGDVNSVGTVSLTNTSGKECRYIIEGSGYSMQDVEEILGCYQ